MELHYIISLYEKSPGVQKKIDQQIRAFCNNHVQAKKVILPAISVPFFKRDDIKTGNPLLTLINYLYSEIISYFYLVNYSVNLEKNDILYLRMPVPSPLWILFFYKHSHLQICVEHQSKEMKEYLTKGNIIYPFLDLIFGGLMRSLVTYHIGVTPGIVEYQINRTICSKESKFLMISNGIEVSSAPLRKKYPIFKKKLVFIFIGSIKYWHGIDRFIEGLKHYSGEYRITFNIYGDNKKYSDRKRITLNSYVEINFHDAVSGEYMDSIFESSHIAISSLGVYREGLPEMCPLKSREYCSRGIPFVFSTKDPDFPPEFPYTLEFKEDESEISIDQIIDFLKNVYKDESFSKKMNNYAKNQLEWSNKLIPLTTIITQSQEASYAL